MDIRTALLNRAGRNAVLPSQLNQQQNEFLVRAAEQIARRYVQCLFCVVLRS